MTPDYPSRASQPQGAAPKAEANARPLAYGLLALENLNLIGIAAGDSGRAQVIAHVGELLRSRFGSDSVLDCNMVDGFLVALWGATSDAVLHDLQLFIHELPLHGIIIDGKSYAVTSHAGLIWAANSLARGDQDALLRQLRIATEAARHGGGIVVLPRENDALHPIALMSELLCGLPTALREGRLLLHAQEIVDCSLEGEDAREYEVLVQLRGSDGNIYPPADFLGGAESSFLIEMLDRLVFSDVLVKHAPLLHARPGLSLSLNVSARSLCNPGFAPFLAGLFERGGIAPSRIQIEITETSAIRDIEQAKATVEAARTLGCRIALDDFGAGMSGYGYLKAFSPDCIKIDGVLIPDVVDAGSPDVLIVQSIIDLAHSMGIRVVAEHVSSTEIHTTLIKLGIDKVQGHLFGLPEPLSTLILN